MKKVLISVLSCKDGKKFLNQSFMLSNLNADRVIVVLKKLFMMIKRKERILISSGIEILRNELVLEGDAADAFDIDTKNFIFTCNEDNVIEAIETHKEELNKLLKE